MSMCFCYGSRKTNKKKKPRAVHRTQDVLLWVLSRVEGSQHHWISQIGRGPQGSLSPAPVSTQNHPKITSLHLPLTFFKSPACCLSQKYFDLWSTYSTVWSFSVILLLQLAPSLYPSQVPDFIFTFVELHEDPLCPFLQHIEVALSDNTTICCINHSSVLHRLKTCWGCTLSIIQLLWLIFLTSGIAIYIKKGGKLGLNHRSTREASKSCR